MKTTVPGLSFFSSHDFESLGAHLKDYSLRVAYREDVNNMKADSYPDIIKKLPKVKHSMEGVEGWLAQGDNFQIAFFEIQPTAKVPPHSHGAQFGVVMHGEMVLTIGDDTQVYGKGDTYIIPEGVTHHAVCKSVVLAMDFFDQADRYETE